METTTTKQHDNRFSFKRNWPRAIILALCCSYVLGGALQEHERVREYYARGYEWPIRKFQPNNDGWNNLYSTRLEQIAEMDDYGERYEAYLHTIHSGLLMPNFTEYGFGLGRAPPELTAELQEAIRQGLEGRGYNRYNEGKVDVIEGPSAVMISRPDLLQKVKKQLHPYVEAWSGQKVVPYTAYGFRLYQNQSALHMHVDKFDSHVLSFIYHIDSSEDAEPWPIFIESVNGTTYEVILAPGDLLFYESSKCFHGRPRKFVGSWYTSVFVHYYPLDWQSIDHSLEAHYAIPPQWRNDPPSKLHLQRTGQRLQPKHAGLQMAGTAMKEPSCPNEWCRTENTIKWNGPGEEGYWIAPDLRRHPLILPDEADNSEL